MALAIAGRYPFIQFPMNLKLNIKTIRLYKKFVYSFFSFSKLNAYINVR
jgi:hypothetical protein